MPEIPTDWKQVAVLYKLPDADGKEQYRLVVVESFSPLGALEILAEGIADGIGQVRAALKAVGDGIAREQAEGEEAACE